jgi:Rieske Fe-S protein
MDESSCSGGCACQRDGVTSTEGSGIRADDRGAVSRRGLLAGSAAAVATLALGACASTEEAASGSSTTPAETSGSGSAPASPEASSQSAAASPGTTGEVLATTTEFPVGGGKVVTTASGVVVVTQPADGQFQAFNGKCPHQGCPVSEVTENTIVCQCHGSTFDGSTGERMEGPAPVGLKPVAITVEGDTITLA